MPLAVAKTETQTVPALHYQHLRRGAFGIRQEFKSLCRDRQTLTAIELTGLVIGYII